MKSLNKKNLAKINRMLNAYQCANMLHNKHRKSENKENRAWASYQFRKNIVIAIDLYKEFGINLVSERYFENLDENWARFNLEQAKNNWLDLVRQRKEREKAAA